jgi:hypothetical protein
MSKKQKRAIQKRILADTRVSVVIKNLRLKDLQRECVIRGMDFWQVPECSVLNLHSWLVKNWDNPIDKKLIFEYDKYMDEELEALGRSDLIHPSLSLGYFENPDTGEITKKRVKEVNPQRKFKKERTSEGIFTGTKKAYTYELAKKGIPKPEAIDLVIEKYPEANEKSISIWYNKAKKLNGK